MRRLLGIAVVALPLLAGCGPNGQSPTTSGGERTAVLTGKPREGEASTNPSHFDPPKDVARQTDPPRPKLDPLAVLREMKAEWKTDGGGRVVSLNHTGYFFLLHIDANDSEKLVEEKRAKAEALKSLRDLEEVAVDSFEVVAALGDLPKLKRLTVMRVGYDDAVLSWVAKRKGLELFCAGNICSGGLIEDTPLVLSAEVIKGLNAVKRVELGFDATLKDYRQLKDLETLRALQFKRLYLGELKKATLSAKAAESFKVGEVIVELEQATNGGMLDKPIVSLKDFSYRDHLKELHIGSITGTNSNPNFGAETIPLELKGLDFERPVIRLDGKVINVGKKK